MSSNRRVSAACFNLTSLSASVPSGVARTLLVSSRTRQSLGFNIKPTNPRSFLSLARASSLSAFSLLSLPLLSFSLRNPPIDFSLVRADDVPQSSYDESKCIKSFPIQNGLDFVLHLLCKSKNRTH